jgi:5-methyltetrahydrofolate--homocysteine methyltransferase
MSKSNVTLMDGAMGTMLLAHGIPMQSCFEELNLSRPGLVFEIHRSYVDAGAEALLANTFGANRPRLFGHRLAKRIEAINRSGIRIAKKAAGRRPVFASIGPLGKDAKKMAFSQMFDFFQEQVRVLERESPAGYIIETMVSLTEAEAATTAARKNSDRTIMTLMTRPLRGPDLSAAAAEIVATTLRSAGANVIGSNCGAGPEDSYAVLKALSKVDKGPFAVRISGGLAGHTLPASDLAEWGPKFQKLGCRWIGGCCGTTPAHLRAIKQSL